MIKLITSAQNPLIKQLTILSEKSKLRKETGTCIVEGVKEITMAIQCGYNVLQLLFNNSRFTAEEVSNILPMMNTETEIIELTKDVYAKLAYRESTEGVIAVVKTKAHGLDQLLLHKKNPLILIAEAPEKPGNIGALLRTADAAGVDAFIIANPLTDLYNPNIIRSSVGTVFSTQVAVGTTAEILHWLQEKRISIYCAALSASIPYYSCDFTGPAALVVGTESTGLSELWLEGGDQNVIIPMNGKIDSMNVSVSAAILIFEAVRQRKLNQQ